MAGAKPFVILSANGRRNLADLAADQIRDAIVAGYFDVGTRLGIEELAEKVGVSTMPIREALIALEQEGLVERLPRRGFRVAGVEPDDVADLFLVHAFLAGVLAERAARFAAEETIHRLRAIHNQTLIAGQLRRSTSAAARIENLNHEFHRTINRSVDAPRLRWFLRTTTRSVPRSFYQSIPGWIEATMDDHPAILDAIERRDARVSRKLMERHVQHGGELVIDAFSRSPSLLAKVRASVNLERD